MSNNRIPLTQLKARWELGQRRYAARMSRRPVHALYREMIEFEPIGLISRAAMRRFMNKYQPEIRCLFGAPFLNKPQEVASQRQFVKEKILWAEASGLVPIREEGEMEYIAMLDAIFDVDHARTAYQQALEHVWRTAGGTGKPPTAPESDPSLLTEAELEGKRRYQPTMDRRRLHYQAAHAAAAAAKTPQAPPAVGDTTRASTPDDRPLGAAGRPMLRAVAHGSPADGLLPDIDRVEWPGKLRNESPRDMMRPYLTEIRRLDLLDGYSDEIVQYGERVSYLIDGEWR